MGGVERGEWRGRGGVSGLWRARAPSEGYIIYNIYILNHSPHRPFHCLRHHIAVSPLHRALPNSPWGRRGRHREGLVLVLLLVLVLVLVLWLVLELVLWLVLVLGLVLWLVLELGLVLWLVLVLVLWLQPPPHPPPPEAF